MMSTATPLLLKSMRREHESPAVDVIANWYALLQQQRGIRAPLRRAQTDVELMMCEGFRLLAQPFQHWLNQYETEKEWRWLGLALAAGAGAHVKALDNHASFAAQLGKSHSNTHPVLSELRFNRLLRAHDRQEFYRLIVRAVRQCERVNLWSLIDGILLWCREQDELAHDRIIERRPFHRPALRWAIEYFQATEAAEE